MIRLGAARVLRDINNPGLTVVTPPSHHRDRLVMFS
jgi:hypothetical protein